MLQNLMDPGMYHDPAKFTEAEQHCPGPSLAVLRKQQGMEAAETPSLVEEMLLSKVHVQLQILRVGGQQTNLSGLSCLFPRDHGPLRMRLPLLPSELDVLIIKPKGPLADQPTAALGRRPEPQVKRARLLASLNALPVPPQLSPSRDRPRGNQQSCLRTGPSTGDLRSTTLAPELGEPNSRPGDRTAGGEEAGLDLLSGAMISISVRQQQ